MGCNKLAGVDRVEMFVTPPGLSVVGRVRLAVSLKSQETVLRRGTEMLLLAGIFGALALWLLLFRAALLWL
jgi:hypothetical protein